MYNTEITALLQLIDDPDKEVFETVAHKLADYGKEIIPRLEQLWEIAEEILVQERIQLLIHRVHFQSLQAEFYQWSNTEKPDILRGLILVAKYQYPDINIPSVLAQFDQMRKSIWLELNNYLTPIEQINILNSILYDYYKLQGQELAQRNPNYYFINQVLDTHQGNPYSIGVLYLALCELLDIPVFAVSLPGQFVFAYMDTLHHFLQPDDDPVLQIRFFIDPINGMLYTQNDVNAYLLKLGIERRLAFYTPISAQAVIYRMLQELNHCYQYNYEAEKAVEIEALMRILQP
jgi:regulator of sirC expression with transglutaminase-like and TPR domain